MYAVNCVSENDTVCMLFNCVSEKDMIQTENYVDVWT